MGQVKARQCSLELPDDLLTYTVTALGRVYKIHLNFGICQT